MATRGIVGAVAGMWRFAVKSMRGERLERADLTERGLVGDRAYGLIDAATGKVVSAKSARRFRMNVIVDANETGFVENDWVGFTLTIGDAVRLSVAVPCPRCVMTTLAQDELPKDTDILRALI